MKRFASALLVAGLAAMWVGCQSSTEPDVAAPSADEAPAATSDLTLVTLKVPNMT